MTCNIANIKINLPAVAGLPLLRYLSPRTPATTYYAFPPLPDSTACPFALFTHPPYSSLIFLSPFIFSYSIFPHCALWFPHLISCTPTWCPLIFLRCPSPLSSYWSSAPSRLNIYPSFHPFTAVCICVAYLFINFLYRKYQQFYWLASPSFSSSL